MASAGKRAHGSSRITSLLLLLHCAGAALQCNSMYIYRRGGCRGATGAVVRGGGAPCGAVRGRRGGAGDVRGARGPAPRRDLAGGGRLRARGRARTQVRVQLLPHNVIVSTWIHSRPHPTEFTKST